MLGGLGRRRRSWRGCGAGGSCRGHVADLGLELTGLAEVADEEGFKEVAQSFRAISVAEKQHEKRYATLAASVESGQVFKKETKIRWRCLNCGYIHEGKEAPKLCPACDHPQSYYELLGENW